MATLPAHAPTIEHPSPRRDLAIVVVVTLCTAILSAYFDLSETIVAWTRPWEHLQLDEIPAVLVALSTALAWFARRRHRESRMELRRRRAAEARLENLLRDNRRLGQQLVQVQESERKTLARELHDELGQYLNAIKIEAITLEHGDVGGNGSLREAAARIVQHTDHVYGVVRDLIRQLRPVALDTLGLRAALEHHVHDWRQRSPNTRLDIAFDGELDDVGEVLALAVFRLVQEALTNVSRHAQAQRAEVRVRRTASENETAEIAISIVDDGCGVDMARVQSGLGLLGMRERIEMLGGRLHIRAQPQRGFSIEARIPIEQHAREPAA